MSLSKPLTIPRSTHNRFQRLHYFLIPVILPVLLANVPTLYHYSNNVEKLTLGNLSRMLVFNTVLALLFYVVLLVLNRFHGFEAANATFVFLIFFNIYGLAYKYLLHLDVIRIKHYTLLPLTLLVAAYSMLFIIKVQDRASVTVWKSLTLVVSVLVLFNLINIIPREIARWENNRTATSADTVKQVSLTKDSPDIYYIIFDEFEGFQGMREYWQYDGVNEFVDFLKKKGFFVAEASHASSTDTLHEMATRLNYREYPLGEVDLQTYFNDIADNQVMRYLKSRGYTTVVFDERKLGYPSAKTIQADYSYEYGSPVISQGRVGTYGLYFDEFGELVIDNTMLYAISQKYKSNNPLVDQHIDMISFTIENIANPEVPSPKFTYVHLLLPHAPFVFDPNGNITDNSHFTNWNYYIDNYKFAIKVAEQLVNNILARSDPNRPPVIILQSDHGARNTQGHNDDSMVLKNYPEKYKTLIMYALYLPGYDGSALTQHVHPANTFPIVFNYLFDAHIPLLK